MKLTRHLTLLVLFGVGLGLSTPEFAAAQMGGRRPFPGRGPLIAPPGVARRARVPVVIHPRSTLRRAPRPVVVRPRSVVRPLIAPRLFLPPIVFGGTLVIERHGRRYRHDDGDRRGYSRDNLVWRGTETLYREDEWTEFTLDCNARGTMLWFEVRSGRVQVDWAEVVFENGEVQVVEFPERAMGRGIYELLDFRDGRRVDYVRMVAQTTSREAQLTLWLER